MSGLVEIRNAYRNVKLRETAWGPMHINIGNNDIFYYDMDWTDLAHTMVQRQIFVNMGINLETLKGRRIFDYVNDYEVLSYDSAS
jgi:hypothetical protein